MRTRSTLHRDGSSSRDGGEQPQDDSAAIAATSRRAATGDVEAGRPCAAEQRDFLDATAVKLSMSRVRELEELKDLINRLGTAVSKLYDVRALVETTAALPAILNAKVTSELQSALRLPTPETRALITTVHATTDQDDVEDFSSNFKSTIEMLLM